MKVLRTASFVLAVLFIGCKTPPALPEVQRTDIQEKDLWKAGASIFASQDCENYLSALARARQKLARENLKLGWLRDYGDVRDDFLAVFKSGNALLAKVQALKTAKLDSLNAASRAVREKLLLLNDITLSITERGQARKQLTQAEILLKEAEVLTDQCKLGEASKKIDAAAGRCRDAEEAVVSFIGRYLDPRQVEIWKKWTTETIEESKARGIIALVVSKLERRMTVYKNGQVFRTYEVGLGFNGLSDKLHAGDNATPEGRYRITGKIPSSQYYKALVINYPNDEDKKRFARERSRGSIPAAVGIGGDIEIHGGGCDTLTRGCISLDDRVMDELYALVGAGTPVTIVGTNEMENYVIRAIRRR